MNRYDPSQIEPKWQQTWSKTGLYTVTEDATRPKYYMLTEFPYPSGEGLHAGHIREYTLGDVMARYKRMQGFNVLYPFGFDEFGLPTENYAIKHKIAPQLATRRNVTNFKRQLGELGYSIDWSREVGTSDPNYYRWTQWLFLQFLQAGLAYQDEIAINWCPFEKTGLANEEVVNGKHERCGTPVEKKLLKQWILRITDYADRLIEGLKTVDYPDRISSQQINWIGRSEGAEIDFKLATSEGRRSKVEGRTDEDAIRHSPFANSLTVYTTRPDTIFGATFIVVAPEVARDWMDAGWQPSAAVKTYVTTSIAKAELERQESKDKTGVDTGITAVHPLTGAEIPVWVADYVLGGYGTGAIMAVPAHDERDYAFAVKFNLPITQVVMPKVVDPDHPHRPDKPYTQRTVAMVILKHPTKDEFLALHYHKHPWRTLITGGVEAGEDLLEAAKREITEETGYKNLTFVSRLPQVIESHFYAEHKDVNRQVKMNVLVFKLDNLEQTQTKLEAHEQFDLVWTEMNAMSTLWPVSELSYILDWLARGDQPFGGSGPLINSGDFDGLEGQAAKSAIIEQLRQQGSGRGAKKYKLRDWVFSRQHYWGEPIPVIYCRTDGIVPVPDDQLPVVLPEVESYEPTDTGESPLAAMTDWVNVICPKCGGPATRETDTMPNWAGSNWYYLRYMDAHNSHAFVGEKALNYWQNVDMYLGGMEHTTLHLLYSRFCHQFLFDQGLVPTPEPYAARRGQGIVLAADGRKMSKSLGNVINPSDIVAKYGADTLRLYVLFMAPYDESTPWSDERLGGVNRFIYRVWSLAEQLDNAGATNSLSEVDRADGTFETLIDRAVHKTIKQVHDELGAMKFNTAISSLMSLINVLSSGETIKLLKEPRHAALANRSLRSLILMLAPFTPYVAEELWYRLGAEESVHVQPFPKYDEVLIRDDVVELAVQVNGKLRGTIMAATEATEAEVTAAAKANPNVAKFLDGDIVKTIVVPRRLVNFVVK